MTVTLPLGDMTTDEKLRMMDQIWEDLCRSTTEVPSPAWHGDVLSAREARAAEGSARLMDWEEAKRRIRDAVS